MPRKVLAAVDDMLFAAKIRATAEQLNVEVNFVRSCDALLASAQETKPDLIIMDLQSQKFDAVALGKELKARADLQKITLLGFYSHVLAELHRSAIEAGFDGVVPRSLFSRDLAKILAGGSESR
jgi:CheY-like chemotaxis protein